MVLGRAAAAALLVAAIAGPTAAQQADRASSSVPRLLNLRPPSIESGKPANLDPALSAAPDQALTDGCAPAWPCRLRLFGRIERNSGIGLKGTALTW